MFSRARRFEKTELGKIKFEVDYFHCSTNPNARIIFQALPTAEIISLALFINNLL
jgi:hypothetical protein